MPLLPSSLDHISLIRMENSFAVDLILMEFSVVMHVTLKEEDSFSILLPIDELP